MSAEVENPADLPAVTGETKFVLGAVADFLAQIGHEIPLERAVNLTEVEARQVSLVAGFVDDRGPGLRAAVGAYLLGQKPEDGEHGEWTDWLAVFAKNCGRSVRSLDRWMLEAQKRYGLPAPKGAIPSRRDRPAPPNRHPRHDGEDGGSSVIEATAREVPQPAPSLSIVPAAPAEPQVSAPAPAPRRSDDAVDVAVERLQAMLDVHPVVWAKVAQQWRTQVAAVASALATALEQTAPKELAVPKVNEVTPPRRQGTIRRPGQQVVEVAAGAPCEHPKVKVRVVGIGSICDACGAFKRAGVWQATT